MINRRRNNTGSNRWKLKMLCKWLAENGVNDYVEKMMIDGGVMIDLYLPTQNIAVHISNKYNQQFYMAVREDFRPFYIRCNDSIDFVLEKMRNCLDGHTCKTAPKHKKAANNDK